MPKLIFPTKLNIVTPSSIKNTASMAFGATLFMRRHRRKMYRKSGIRFIPTVETF